MTRVRRPFGTVCTSRGVDRSNGTFVVCLVRDLNLAKKRMWGLAESPLDRWFRLGVLAQDRQFATDRPRRRQNQDRRKRGPGCSAPRSRLRFVPVPMLDTPIL